MRMLFACALALLMPVAAFAADADQKAEGQVSDACKAWLVLVDQGKYAEAWSRAGSDFQKAVTADKWAAAIKPLREPLGAAVWRHPSGVVMQASGLGGRDGALVFFTTDFANKKQVLEKLTVSAEGGGWRIASYTIKLPSAD